MESTKELKSLRLGSAPVGKLIFAMSAPAMISMLVQALYNTVDSVFVSHYSEAGLAALSLAFPMQLLVLAFSLGIGVGANSVISRKLGEGKYEEAGQAAQNGVFLALCTGAFFAVIGYFLSRWFIGLYTDDAQIYQMGYRYLSICVCCMVFSCAEICLTRSLQATGNMIVPMVCQLVGAITNIVLDPLLIFGYLGGQPLGVVGAAIATVVGQAAALTVAVVAIAVKRHKLDIQILFKRFRPKLKVIRQILSVGFPALILNATGSVMYLVCNFILISFSTVAVSVFGVFYKLESLVFMPTFGLNQGVMPIFGYNYGAGNKARFKKALSISLATAFVMMLIGFVLFQAIPGPILSLFNAGPEMLAIGIPALRICSVCFLPAAIGVIIIAMFNAVGHGVKAMLISVMRQIAFLLPVGYGLSRVIGLPGFWAGFPIAEAAVLIIFIPIAVRTVRKIFRDKESELSAAALAESATPAAAPAFVGAPQPAAPEPVFPALSARPSAEALRQKEPAEDPSASPSDTVAAALDAVSVGGSDSDPDTADAKGVPGKRLSVDKSPGI